MIISKSTQLSTLLCTALIASAAFAAPSEAKIGDCRAKAINVEKAKSVTWWDWLTNNRSSQFHFFQLMELLHGDEDNKDTSASVIREEQAERNA